MARWRSSCRSEPRERRSHRWLSIRYQPVLMGQRARLVSSSETWGCRDSNIRVVRLATGSDSEAERTPCDSCPTRALCRCSPPAGGAVRGVVGVASETSRRRQWARTLFEREPSRVATTFSSCVAHSSTPPLTQSQTRFRRFPSTI